MIRRPPRTTRTDTLFPNTTLFRSGFRRKGGQKVVLFNPTDREGRTARYNPLSYINRADPIEVLVEVQKIATMLFVPPEKGEAFWTESARTAFVGIASWIAAKPE